MLIKILAKLFSVFVKVVTTIWLIAAVIPLLIGITMIDIALKMVCVEKYMLLWTRFTAWTDQINAYLKLKPSKENNKNV